MSEDMDEKLAGLLLGDAPPVRDPLFRLGVLARRERQRFRRRSLMLSAAMLVCIAFFVTATVTDAGMFETFGALALGAILVVSYFLYAPVLTQVLRSLAATR